MRRGLISVLLISVFTLLGIGIIVLASASTAQSVRLHNDPHFLLQRQLLWIALGLVMLVITQHFDYHYFKLFSSSFKVGKLRFIKFPTLAVAMYMLTVLALILVFIPPFGKNVNGSWRWLNLYFFRIQPSEFAKIVMIIAMSVWLDRIGTRAGTFKRGIVLSFAILAPIAGLVVMETDVGATIVISMLAVVLMVVAGASLKYLLPMAGIGIAGMATFIALGGGNRMQRVKAWLFSFEWARKLFNLPDDFVLEQGDHLRASLHAIQRGGVFGVGYTDSLEKLRYLPESHTDFVFPIGAEEFGLIFSLLVVSLFVVLLICGMIISCRAPDKLGRYLAFGFTFMIVFQAMFNLAVVTGLAPTKGIALPFFSYGGTSIFSILIAVGFLVNVAKHIETRSEDVHTRSERNALRQI